MSQAMDAPSPSRDFSFPCSADSSADQLGYRQMSDSENINNIGPVHDRKSSYASQSQWMIFSKDLDTQEIKMNLHQYSWRLLKQIQFDDWIGLSLENYSTAVVILGTYHGRLAFSLFDFLCHFPHEAGKYRSILEVCDNYWFSVGGVAHSMQESGSEGFLYQVVLHALKNLESSRPYMNLELDTRFVTEPLHALLSEPDANILSRLKILKARYTRYKMGLGLIEGRYFDIETGFLDLLMNESPRSVAIELSQNVLKLFRHLSLESILTHDSNLRLLGIQWNQMCLDAKEIAIADVQQDKMVAVAKVIFSFQHSFSILLWLINSRNY
jgi:hypothetical protein